MTTLVMGRLRDAWCALGEPAPKGRPDWRSEVRSEAALGTGGFRDPESGDENMPIGARVTLRGDNMYEFLDRFISVALPRVRDFKGVNNKSFDGRGNYTIGITEQIIFPEIDIDKITKITGMDITIVTTAETDAEAYELLKGLGMPFRKS